MNALLYSANSSAQTIASGQTISFGAPVRRYGRNIQLSGGNVILNGEGYYPIEVNVTFTASAVGTEVAQILENGVAIPGASASVTTTADGVATLTIPAAARIKCCEEKVISVVLTGVQVTVSNASILVEKS